MRANRRLEGGKICRRRHQLPGRADRTWQGKPLFYGFFSLARGLLILMA
jgi:hypothetical protein